MISKSRRDEAALLVGMQHASANKDVVFGELRPYFLALRPL